MFATGMVAQELNVQVIANNIANMQTTAYKKQRAEFSDLIYENLRRPGANTSNQGTRLPVGLDIGGGVKTTGTPRLMNPRDLAEIAQIQEKQKKFPTYAAWRRIAAIYLKNGIFSEAARAFCPVLLQLTCENRDEGGLKAPSANSRRNRFGSLNATKKASAPGPAPNAPATRTSRPKPRTRLTRVRPPTVAAGRRTLMLPNVGSMPA